MIHSVEHVARERQLKMFKIWKFKTVVVGDLKTAVYVEVQTVQADQYKGIANEVLILSDEDEEQNAQPEVRVRVALRHTETVQVFEVGAKALAPIPKEEWPLLREALANTALIRMGQLMGVAGITLPAVIIREAQEIRRSTFNMLLGLPDSGKEE